MPLLAILADQYTLLTLGEAPEDAVGDEAVAGPGAGVRHVRIAVEDEVEPPGIGGMVEERRIEHQIQMPSLAHRDQLARRPGRLEGIHRSVRVQAGRLAQRRAGIGVALGMPPAFLVGRHPVRVGIGAGTGICGKEERGQEQQRRSGGRAAKPAGRSHREEPGDPEPTGILRIRESGAGSAAAILGLLSPESSGAAPPSQDRIRIRRTPELRSGRPAGPADPRSRSQVR